MADEKKVDNTADDEGGADDDQSADDDSSADDSDEGASGGDVSGGKDSDGKNGKKGSRAGTRISDLVRDNKRLETQNEDMAVRLEALETAIAKGGAPDTKKDARSDDNPAIQKLKKLGYTDDQIEAAKAVYAAVAGQTDSEVKKEVENLRAKLAANEEKEALNDAIIKAKTDGIEVTPKQIAEFRAQCLKSSDPREQLLAEAPYPRIIKLMIADGVIERSESKDDESDEDGEEDAEDNEDRSKRSKAPKIPKGKDSRQEKKPTSKKFQFDPGNAQAGMDAIERRVLARMSTAEDNE